MKQLKILLTALFFIFGIASINAQSVGIQKGEPDTGVYNLACKMYAKNNENRPVKITVSFYVDKKKSGSLEFQKSVEYTLNPNEKKFIGHDNIWWQYRITKKSYL